MSKLNIIMAMIVAAVAGVAAHPLHPFSFALIGVCLVAMWICGYFEGKKPL